VNPWGETGQLDESWARGFGHIGRFAADYRVLLGERRPRYRGSVRQGIADVGMRRLGSTFPE
jgi:hypothetical protein